MNEAAPNKRQWRFDFYFERRGQTSLWDYVDKDDAEPDPTPDSAGRERWARLSLNEGNATEKKCWVQAFVSIPEDDDPEDWEPVAFELARQCLSSERGGQVPD